MLWESLDYLAGKRPPEEAMEDERSHAERNHVEENWSAPAELPSNGANTTESRRAAHGGEIINYNWQIMEIPRKEKENKFRRWVPLNW